MNNLPPGLVKIGAILLAIALILTILIDVGLFIAWAFRKEDADAGRRPPLFAPQWSLVDVWAGGQIALILINVVGIVALLVFSPEILSLRGSGNIGNSATKLPFIFVATVAQNVIFFGIPAGFIIGKYRTPLSQIGLPPLPTRQQVLTGIKLAFALIALAFVLEQVLTFVLKHAIGGQFAKQLEELTKALTLEGLLKGKMTWGAFLVFLFCAGIAAPIGEEMFFRGFLYNCAKRRFGVTAGVIISAAAFALAHLGPLAVIVIFSMGVVLAVTYERTGSLWVTIIMHATNNSLAIIGVFVIKNLGKG
jgi:membrane protease YdiL (CAAX protease family)